MSDEMNPNKKSNFENILRPKNFDDYVGQDSLKKQLKTYIKAAKIRNDKHIDHILVSGPPGLGKTTIAHIVANEMDANIKTIMAPAIDKPGDLVAILMSLSEGDVLFVDEIHALKRNSEEMLYSAMEDFKVDILIEDQNHMTLDIPKFTLIGATTRKGLISSPLLDRFGIVLQLEYYNQKELNTIIKANAKKLEIEFEDDGLMEIAKRSRGTPRIANKLLNRVRDYALVENNGMIEKEITEKTLNDLGVDKYGLEEPDRKVIKTMYIDLNNRPVGLESISKTSGEDKETLERVIEPFLIKEKLIRRTPKGRELTDKGSNYAESLVE